MAPTMPTPASDEHALRAEVRRWISATWDPDLTVGAWWALLADSGWGFPTWPRAWFGRDLHPADGPIVHEELAAARVLGPPVGVGQSMGAPVLFVHGTESQRQRWLPALARGEESWCQFFSEPGAGSDLAAVATRAVPVDGGWRVTGQKVWNSGTTQADRGLLLARTDPDRPKHKGLSFMVVDLDRPGIEVRPIRQMNGLAEFNETFFTEVEVPDASLIGEPGAGFRVAMTTLTHERSSFAGGGDRDLATADPGRSAGNLDRRLADVLAEPPRWNNANALPLGSPEALIDLARELGRHRDPVVRQRLAHLVATARALHYTELRALTDARAGRSSEAASSVAYLGGVAVVRLCRDLVAAVAGPAALLDGPGALRGGDVAMSVTTAPCHGIQGGSEQIQRNVIGERILGLPKEPQLDREVPFRELRTAVARD